MKILGINAFHPDSSAALIENGVIIAAIQEERLNRIKHWSGFPKQSINWCLKSTKNSFKDINYITINTNPRANFWKKINFILKTNPSIQLIFNRFKANNNKKKIYQIFEKNYCNSFDKRTFKYIEHHRSHLASAFYPSSFNKSVVLSVDGFGDFSSCSWGIGENSIIKIDKKISFPHSLGIFYTTITQYLGFTHYGDEYKVMGLAPYGKDTYVKKLSKLINLRNDGTFELNLSYFKHHKEIVSKNWDGGVPLMETNYTQDLIELLGPPRKSNELIKQKHKDIAKAAQIIYEKAFFNILTFLNKKYKLNKLCIAGGCGANSVANGKILNQSGFDEIYIAPDPGDAGGAIGSALEVWHQISSKRSSHSNSCFYGYKEEKQDIQSLLFCEKNQLIFKKNKIKIINFKDNLGENFQEKKLLKIVSEAISKGDVVGWYQDKMEWGPRALGNRSILCDPRNSKMKSILNKKIKKRESFRPFAPSILQEKVKNWFDINKDNLPNVPFMMQVWQIRDEKQKLIPAVTHVDGSGRLQTVNEKENGKYYRLIKAFEDITDIPMILNTSFNENEPIVCKAREALNCFLRTEMDILVLEDYLLKRI